MHTLLDVSYALYTFWLFSSLFAKHYICLQIQCVDLKIKILYHTYKVTHLARKNLSVLWYLWFLFILSSTQNNSVGSLDLNENTKRLLSWIIIVTSGYFERLFSLFKDQDSIKTFSCFCSSDQTCANLS